MSGELCLNTLDPYCLVLFYFVFLPRCFYKFVSSYSSSEWESVRLRFANAIFAVVANVGRSVAVVAAVENGSGIGGCVVIAAKTLKKTKR